MFHRIDGTPTFQRRATPMKTPWPEDIGRVARQRRIDLNLSQDELAARSGITRQWLSRFESAKADVSLSKVLAVLRELDLEVDVRVSQPPLVPALSTLATDSIMRAVAKINENLNDSIADSVQRTARGMGISETAKSALDKLTLDPNYRQAMQKLKQASLGRPYTDPDPAPDRAEDNR